MVASHGEGFPSGDVHGGGFQAIQEYFQQRSCRYCSRPFLPEGIQLVREEPGVLVVKVGCSDCGRPLGIALVGMNQNANTQAQTQQPLPSCPEHPPGWSKRDIQRLSGKPAITYDDVLRAHQFLNEAGDAWGRHLPTRKQRLRTANI